MKHSVSRRARRAGKMLTALVLAFVLIVRAHLSGVYGGAGCQPFGSAAKAAGAQG